MSKLVLENKNNLPKGWVETILDELIVKMSNGTTAKQIQEKTKYPVSRIETISNEFVDFVKVRYLNNPTKDIIEKYKIEQGDILFSNINSDIHLGKTAIFYENQTLIHGMNLLLIRPESRIVIPKFLNFYFKYYRNLGKFISIAQHAVNQSSINQTKLKNLDFIIPPLNEQKRIVAKIEELFSLLDSTKEILEKTKILLKQYSQSLLKSAFEGKLVSQDPNDEPASMLLEKIRRGKDSKSKIDFGMSKLILEKNNGLPKGWILSRMQDIVLTPKNDIVDGPFGSNLKATEYVDDGIPIIRLQNVDRNQFINKNIRYVTKEKAKQLQRHSFLKNDIVITKLGFPVGKATLVPEYLENGIIVADILRMRVLDKFVSRKFLTYLINSEIITKQFANHTQGTTRPRVNLTKFRDFIIPLPPLNEQKRIVAKIEESFFLIHNSEKSVDALFLQNNLLKTSTLKQAFEGKLVPQDPNDEPAEILLEKIKAEKEQLIQKQKASRSTKNVK